MWKQILEAPNYSVNELGKIKNNTNGKLLKTYLDNIGYVIAKLTLKPYYSKPFKVHRLVAKYFVDNVDNKPIVNHIDGDKTNNNYKNLEWCTQSENVKAAFDTGLNTPKKGTLNGMAKLTEEDVKWIREHYIPRHSVYGCSAMGRKYNVAKTTISAILTNKSWN